MGDGLQPRPYKSFPFRHRRINHPSTPRLSDSIDEEEFILMSPSDLSMDYLEDRITNSEEQPRNCDQELVAYNGGGSEDEALYSAHEPNHDHQDSVSFSSIVNPYTPTLGAATTTTHPPFPVLRTRKRGLFQIENSTQCCFDDDDTTTTAELVAESLSSLALSQEQQKPPVSTANDNETRNDMVWAEEDDAVLPEFGTTATPLASLARVNPLQHTLPPPAPP